MSTPARLLQRGLAEFSVGEAHQAAAVTASPAYGSHLRGTGGRGQARCGGRGAELRRGRGSPAEAEPLSEHPDVGPAGDDVNAAAGSCLLGCGNCAAAPRMRAAARPARGRRSRARLAGPTVCTRPRLLPCVLPPACWIPGTPRKKGAGVSSKCLNLSCRAPESILTGL